jgi:hypothetical protein
MDALLSTRVIQNLLTQLDGLKSSGERVKIAICLSGGLRTFVAAFPSFVKHVVKPNEQQFEFHFFGTFLYSPGDEDEEKALRLLELMIPLLKGYSLFPLDELRATTATQHAQQYGVEHQESVLSKTKFPVPALNVLTMYQAIKLADVERRKYQNLTGTKYAWVARSRPDLLFHTNLDLSQLVDRGAAAAYLPWFDAKIGLAFDQFCIGTPGAMDAYARALETANEAVVNSDLVEFYPERLLWHHLARPEAAIKVCQLTGYDAMLARPAPAGIREDDPYAKLKRDYPDSFS